LNRRAHAIAVIGVATAVFGIAMACRELGNPWWTSVAAAGTATVPSILVLRSQLKELMCTSPREVLAATVVGLALVAATHTTYGVASFLFPGLGVSVAELYEGIQSTMPHILLTLPLVLAVVLAEELVWRGVAFDLMRPRFSARGTILVATALYSVPQLIGGAWLLVLAALVLGLILSIQRTTTKSLAAPLVTHAIWSVSIFVLFPLG
jgi:membrane protease YdiL (CAAX protease family)